MPLMDYENWNNYRQAARSASENVNVQPGVMNLLNTQSDPLKAMQQIFGRPDSDNPFAAISGAFNRYANRRPSADEFDLWKTKMQQGMSAGDVQLAIADQFKEMLNGGKTGDKSFGGVSLGGLMGDTLYDPAKGYVGN